MSRHDKRYRSEAISPVDWMRMRIAEARTDLDEVGDENIECEGRLMILDDETIEDKKIKDKEKVEEEECDAERKK